MQCMHAQLASDITVGAMKFNTEELTPEANSTYQSAVDIGGGKCGQPQRGISLCSLVAEDR